LIELVAEVETPIKDAILVFDNQAKETKRVMAQEHINKTATDLLLNDKYSSKLIVSNEYLNVSMSVKKVKEDIEARAFILQQEQNQEIQNLQIIKDTIENCNKNIDAKMYIEDFKMVIEEDPLSNVLHVINGRCERIKANELKAIEDRKARAEKEVLERIARAEREAIIKAKIEILKANAENEKEVVPAAEPPKEVIIPVIEREIKLDEKMYFIEMRVEGSLQAVKDLSQFLRTNNYKYEATNKGLM